MKKKYASEVLQASTEKQQHISYDELAYLIAYQLATWLLAYSKPQ